MKTNEPIQPSKLALCAAGAVVLGVLVDKAFFLLALGVGAVAVTDAVLHAAREHSGHHHRPARR